MRKQDAQLVALSLAAIAFAVAFVLPQLTPVPVPWYYPVERGWVFAARPPGLAMDFFGRLLLGMAAWCVVAIASFAVARRLRGISDRARGLLVGWAVTITALAMLHFAWTLAFRVPTPAPIPSWYQPR